MSDLGKALMMYGFDANIMLLKMCIFLKIPLMISGVMGSCSNMYRSPIIFKYDLDLDKPGLSMVSELILLTLLIIQIKSVVTSDLNSFRLLLMLAIY